MDYPTWLDHAGCGGSLRYPIPDGEERGRRRPGTHFRGAALIEGNTDPTWSCTPMVSWLSLFMACVQLD
jgi:hypothetical protein